MAKKTKKAKKAKTTRPRVWKRPSDDKVVSYNYDAAAPDAPCIFCGSAARYYVEYECGNLNHRHGTLASCKSCTWILSSATGGQFTIYTKAFDGKGELAQMKTDALEAVEGMIADGRITDTGAHSNDHMRKTDHRIPRNFWGE